MKRAMVGLIGSIAVVISGGIGAGQIPDAYPQAEFGPWSTPVNLGPIVNSPLRDVSPSISRDGLSLYFSSARAGAGTDLYVSRRLAIDLPWETPAALETLNSPGAEDSPALSSDNRYLFFSSIRPDGFGSFDLFVSERRVANDDFGWSPPVRLPSPPNSAGLDVGPTYVEDRGGRPHLYFASGPTAADLDLYMSELRRNGTWTPPEYLAVLNSPVEDSRLAIRFDRLEGVFSSRQGGPDLDLYVTRRKHPSDPWSAPENIGPMVNSLSSDFSPALSPTGRTLYFASARPGGSGDFDLYASTRSRIR
jgi:Tol biopolymer transport system component